MIDEKLKTTPHKPGCYLMKDKNGYIIYVGKSKNLKNRLSSYFKSSHIGKTAMLVKDIYDLALYKNLKQPHLCIYLLNIGINYKDNGKIRDEAYSYFPALPKTIDMYNGFSYCLPPLIEEEKSNE